MSAPGALVPQIVVLGRRSVLGTFRQPAAMVPAFVFPLFIAVVNSSTMGRSTDIPGFPDVDSLLQFFLAASTTHGVLFGGITAGSDTAVDIENGFFDRLLASPVPRTALLVGRLIGAVVLGAFQALVFTAIFFALGVRAEGGVGAIAVLVVYAMLLALFVGGMAATFALRTGSPEAVQNVFPLVFILLFVSSAFFPTQLMSGLYRTVAEANPITWMIDGVRHQVTVGFDAGEALKSFAVAGALAVGAIALANRALRARVRASA